MLFSKKKQIWPITWGKVSLADIPTQHDRARDSGCQNDYAGEGVVAACPQILGHEFGSWGCRISTRLGRLGTWGMEWRAAGSLRNRKMSRLPGSRVWVSRMYDT